MTPTVGQIRAQVKAILDTEAKAAAIGIFATHPGSWPDQLTIAERQYALRWCESPLAVRLALREGRTRQDGGTVILTSLADADLGADVLGRLARGKVFRVQHWDIVRAAFHARDVDARLASLGWIADLLIERTPPEGYPPPPSGVLDAETAWRALLQVALGLDGARPDVDALLRWTAQPDALRRLHDLPDKAQSGLIDWLESVTGPAGGLVAGTVLAGYGADALPLGLVVDVVFAQGSPSGDLAAAAVRIERFTAGRRLDEGAAKRWAEAAVRVVRSLDAGAASSVLFRADSLLSELYLAPYAELSSLLTSGLEGRLGRYAEALSGYLADPSHTALGVVERASASVKQHAQASAGSTRLERVEMATRLARWLANVPRHPAGFAGHVHGYVSDGAFVDWARLKLLGGDQIAALSAALDALVQRVRERREAMNQAFADALKVWNDTGPGTDGAIPIERVLSEVVVPLTQSAPVLLLVLDGLSLPVLAEIAGDLVQLGWMPLQRDGKDWHGVAVSTLPTVTEIARTSLLAGRLVAGAQSVEKTAFARHEALIAAARPSVPILFHKGELSGGLGLAAEVREAVGDRQVRVVGVVYNAIDDQLDGASQLHLRWSLDDLRMLPALLHEARGAGRVVIVTADHGHVIEQGTTQLAGGEGDRWRRSDGALNEGEIRLDGGRVLSPTGEKSVVMPWSERIRYSSRKNGYHGGIALQEVLVPLCVLAPSGMVVPDWSSRPTVLPEWWCETAVAQESPAVTIAAPKILQKPAPVDQGDLFTAPRVVNRDWITALFASATYQTQRTLAARVAPSDQDMQRLLEALNERGGKLSRVVLAQKLGLPPVRIGGFLSAARRVLNVDQASVLSVDEVSGTVELNRGLLAVQFEIREN